MVMGFEVADASNKNNKKAHTHTTHTHTHTQSTQRATITPHLLDKEARVEIEITHEHGSAAVRLVSQNG